jgi:hypothetical protein
LPTDTVRIPDIDDDVDDDHDSNYDPNEDSESNDDESAMSYDSSLASSDNGNDDDDSDDDDSDNNDDRTTQPMPGLSTGVDGDDDNDDKHDDDSNSARSTESTPTIKEEEDEVSVENQTSETIIKPNLETEAQGTENKGVPREENVESAGVPGEEDTEQMTVEREMDERYGTRPTNINLRARKRRDYSWRYGFDETLATFEEPLGKLFLTEQMSLKKGLKRFGKDVASIIRPVMAKGLTQEDKRKSLMYHMYLKEKRCGRIKACGCADGRKQRVYKTKDETSSPTVLPEALFLTSVINAQERRKVITIDIPGTFMHSDMDELVHM